MKGLFQLLPNDSKVARPAGFHPLLAHPNSKDPIVTLFIFRLLFVLPSLVVLWEGVSLCYSREIPALAGDTLYSWYVYTRECRLQPLIEHRMLLPHRSCRLSRKSIWKCSSYY
jgi:hypothetical protein